MKNIRRWQESILDQAQNGHADLPWAKAPGNQDWKARCRLRAES